MLKNVKIRQVGGSKMICLSAAVLKHIGADTELSIHIEEGKRIVLTPPKRTLDELLQHTPRAFFNSHTDVQGVEL